MMPAPAARSDRYWRRAAAARNLRAAGGGGPAPAGEGDARRGPQHQARKGGRRVNAGAAAEVDVAQFAPRLDSLGRLMGFASAVFERRGLPRELLPPVELALEELFTNMVKYGGEHREPVRIEIAASRNGVEVTLTDHDVAQFDVTQVPAVDVTRPRHERAPGGLGLHLTRRLVDRLDYRYDPRRREAHIVFVKSCGDGIAP